MKKVVLKLDLHDDKQKEQARQALSGLSGIDSIFIDMTESKLIVIGDPVTVVSKLLKNWPSTDGKKKNPNEQLLDFMKDFVTVQVKEEMKKLVLKLDLHDDKKKQKAMKAVLGLSDKTIKHNQKEPEKKKENGKKDDGKKNDGKKKDPNEQLLDFMKDLVTVQVKEEMKKVVLKLALDDDKKKQKAMKAVLGLSDKTIKHNQKEPEKK